MFIAKLGIFDLPSAYFFISITFSDLITFFDKFSSFSTPSNNRFIVHGESLTLLLRFCDTLFLRRWISACVCLYECVCVGLCVCVWCTCTISLKREIKFWTGLRARWVISDSQLFSLWGHESQNNSKVSSAMQGNTFGPFFHVYSAVWTRKIGATEL